MSETFEERTDRRLTTIEQTLAAIAEQTALIPTAVNRLMELMGDFRHHGHETGGPLPLDGE